MEERIRVDHHKPPLTRHSILDSKDVAKGVNYERISAVMMFTPHNELIMQFRDDIPGIKNPGRIIFFGGDKHTWLEKPIDVARREIKEELGVEFAANELIFFDRFRKIKKLHGYDGRVSVFKCGSLINPGVLKVNEGKIFLLPVEKAKMASAEDDLKKDGEVSKICSDLVPEYGKITLMAREIIKYYYL